MSESFLACSVCDEIVLKSLNNQIKLRAKVVLVKDDKVLAICKGCDSEIQVPFCLDYDLAKSLSKSDGLENFPRLYLKM